MPGATLLQNQLLCSTTFKIKAILSQIIDWRIVLPIHDIQHLYSSSDQVWIAYRFFEAGRVYWGSSQNLIKMHWTKEISEIRSSLSNMIDLYAGVVNSSVNSSLIWIFIFLVFMCIPCNRFTQIFSNRDKTCTPTSILNFLSKTTDTFLIVCNETNEKLLWVYKMDHALFLS